MEELDVYDFGYQIQVRFTHTIRIVCQFYRNSVCHINVSKVKCHNVGCYIGYFDTDVSM